MHQYYHARKTYLASSQKSVVCKAVIVEILDHEDRIGKTSV